MSSRIVHCLLWFLASIAMLALAVYVTSTYQASERLSALFIEWQTFLPLTLTWDQFLVVVTVFSVVLGAVVLGVCLSAVAWITARAALINRQESARLHASRREVAHVLEAHRLQYEQLVTLAQTLSKQLDKGALIQALVQSASRLTSSPQTNSAVSLWLMHFETETLHFQMGLYCDVSMFVQSKFAPTEEPIARVVLNKKPWLIPHYTEAKQLLRPEKVSRLGAATSMMLVPLVIEDNVLGILIICCHSDVLKGYQTQQHFYEAMWGELALALAIALQGELAILDRLTGVYNRDYFMRRLTQEIDRANRYHLPLTLLMIDIDDFKAVNDTLGHPQGDAVLKIVARVLKHEVRAIDLVGRYGGEEFIVMLPETGFGEDRACMSGSLVVAERIRKGVDDEFHGFQKPLSVTISVGVVVRRFPEDRQLEAKDLLRLADEQLYRAKTTGKNKVCMLTPEQQQPVA